MPPLCLPFLLLCVAPAPIPASQRYITTRTITNCLLSKSKIDLFLLLSNDSTPQMQLRAPSTIQFQSKMPSESSRGDLPLHLHRHLIYQPNCNNVYIHSTTAIRYIHHDESSTGERKGLPHKYEHVNTPQAHNLLTESTTN